MFDNNFRNNYFISRLLMTVFTLIIGSNNLAVMAFAGGHHQKNNFDFSEGKVTKAIITAGPFDLHRKYRSMEGPYISYDFKIGDIVESKEVALPEGLVTFVENGGAAPSMSGGATAQPLPRDVKGLVQCDPNRRNLLWLKGVKLEVLDENDHVLPTAEFICHWNLDVRPAFRNQVFTDGEKCSNSRIATVTQGQTEITFPAGFAVPVASDEVWNAVFQAANRTTDEHRRIKHRCTFYFIKDEDLSYPVKALAWQVPWVYVVIDKNSPQVAEEEKNNCPSCLGISMGVNAPNNTTNGVFSDRSGRRISGHWVIPPGIHTYAAAINDEFEPGFAAKDRIVHAMWSHVHPLCTNLTLYDCVGKSRHKLISVGSNTENIHGLEIKHIDDWSSVKGVVLPAKHNYELEVTYKNNTGVPQDSMAAAGIFFEDPTFARPDWVLKGKDSYACSVRPMTENSTSANQSSVSDSTNTCATTSSGSFSRSVADAERNGVHTPVSKTNDQISKISDSNIVPTPQSILSLPLFDKDKDGPLLTKATSVKVETNAGPLILHIEPALAPVTATAVHKLLVSGAFNGTRFCNYSSTFMLQVAAADDKITGQLPMTESARSLLRRLPLEVSSQPFNRVSHTRYTLGMAHYDDRADSGSSSFFILVQDAPHLDHGYAVFGHLSQDPETLATLARIANDWGSKKFWIVRAKDL